MAADREECEYHSIAECKVQDFPQELDCGKNISWGITNVKIPDNLHSYNLIQLEEDAECNQYSVSKHFKLNYKRNDEVYRWNFGVSSSPEQNNSAYLLLSTSDHEAIEMPVIVHSTIQTMGYVLHVLGFEFFQMDDSTTEISRDKFGVHLVNVTFNINDDRVINDYACDGHQITKRSIKLACVQESGKIWTENGCQTQTWSNLTVICQCSVQESALIGVKTSFNTLAGSADTMPTYFALTVVSTLFLFFTLTILIRFRQVYKDPNKRYIAQLNLTISLFLRHSFLLTGFGIAVFNPLDRYACELVAVFHVYFLITTVLWVLVEGLIIYRKVCKPSLALNIRGTVAITVTVWMLPFLMIVSLSTIEIANDHYIKSAESYKLILNRVESVIPDPDAVYRKMLKYRKFDFCWTTSRMVSIAINVTVLLSLAINIVVLVWVAVVVWKIRSADSDNTPEAMRTTPRVHAQTIVTFRAIVILTMVLNIPWLISLLVNLIGGIEKQSSLVPSYIHFVCVFCQGPLLFYVYCAQKKELKSVIRRKIITNNVKYSIGSRRSPNRINSNSK